MALARCGACCRLHCCGRLRLSPQLAVYQREQRSALAREFSVARSRSRSETHALTVASVGAEDWLRR